MDSDGLEEPLFKQAPNATGLRSLTIKQTVHLNTLRSFGHRTKESQVMQRPVIKSLSACWGTALLPPLEGLLPCCPKPASPSPRSPGKGRVMLLSTGPLLSSFFPLLKMEGKGWLIERPCRAPPPDGLMPGRTPVSGTCCRVGIR